jgi:hypothetical protein
MARIVAPNDNDVSEWTDSVVDPQAASANASAAIERRCGGILKVWAGKSTVASAIGNRYEIRTRPD